MATSNAADALGWDALVGRLKPGAFADVLVVAGTTGDPYRTLIEATERDVALVLVGGRAVYGTPALMTAAGARNPEAIRVAGRGRVVSMVDETIGDADMGYAEAVRSLEAVRRDPVRAIAQAARRADDLRLAPDMPWDEPGAVRAQADPAETTIPSLDPLGHDHAFFDAVEAAPILGGRLDGLRAYYA